MASSDLKVLIECDSRQLDVALEKLHRMDMLLTKHEQSPVLNGLAVAVGMTTAATSPRPFTRRSLFGLFLKRR